MKEQCDYCQDSNNLEEVNQFTVCQQCKEKFNQRTPKCSIFCCIEGDCDASCCGRSKRNEV